MQRKIGIDIHRLDNRIRRCVQRTATQHEMEAVSGTNGRIIRFISEHMDRDVYQRIWKANLASPVPPRRAYCS